MTSPRTTLPSGLHPSSPSVPVIVLGDFGRDAALRFCTELARHERSRVRALLPPDAPFFDEYRRTTLSLVGDLPFAKRPQLEAHRHDGQLLDEGVLIGFPGGPAPEQVADRLGVLLLEALAGPMARGATRAVVALPCNTLAPVSWALDCLFVDGASLRTMLDRAGAGDRADLRAIADAAASLALGFPTVPVATLSVARGEGATAVLPMGTLGIVETYQRARRRIRGAPAVLSLAAKDQRAVLDAIQACLGGTSEDRAAAARSLRSAVDRAEREHGGPVVAVEACTDLQLGVGLDSNATYARAIVEDIYGPDPNRGD